MPNGVQDSNTGNDSISISNVYTSLSDTFTIGGVNPDFTSASEAVSVLNNGGIAGNVVFLIRDGNYWDQLSITEYPGASDSTGVTFQSESGDSTAVTIYNTLGSFVIKLDGADYVTFRNLTIQSNSGTTYRVIELANKASHNHFYNNEIRAPVNTSTSNNRALIFSGFSQDSYNTFEYNKFINGSYGIYLSGGTAIRAEGNIIRHNTFSNQYARSINIERQNFPVISNNVVRSQSTSINYYGIYCFLVGGNLKIESNKLIVPNRGIYLSNAVSTFFNQGVVANNFISVIDNNSSHGIFGSSCSYQNIVFNNVLLISPDTTSSALFMGGSFLNNPEFNSIKCNNLVTRGGGYSMYIQFDSIITSSDYNNLYSTGSRLAYFGGTELGNLPLLQTGSGMDANSISTDPVYVSDSNLHVSSILLKNAGIAVPGITTDFEGDSRDPVTPDIGADEFIANTNDAWLVELISPLVPFANGVQPVLVNILNNGSNTIDSLTIKWTINDTLQPDFKLTNSIISAEHIDSLNIGSYNFKAGTGYEIRVWTQDPNGTPDLYPLNDSIIVPSLFPSLIDTYTIGGVNPDFTNFSSAVDALHLSGIAGPVTFMIRDGVYNEQITINEIQGASSSNQILFRSESGDSSLVNLQWDASGTGDNWIVKLVGTSYIRFERLTFSGLDNIYSRLFEFQDQASYVSINRCVLESVNYNSTSNRRALLFADFGNINNYSITNNRFQYGSSGIYFTSSLTNPGHKIEMNNNQFIDQYEHATYLRFISGIKTNSNTVSTSTGYSFYRGLRFDDCDSVDINKNILNIEYGYGIYMGACDVAFIANNMISLTGSISNYNANGMYFVISNDLEIVFNSVSVSNINTNGQCLYLVGDVQYVKILYNNLGNFGGGYAISISEPNSIVESDYNNIYTSGDFVGNYDARKYSDLAAWNDTSKLDSNSISVNPFYASPTDLHTSNIRLKNAANPYPDINDDIDGDLRDLTLPDIGADEFIPNSNDAWTYKIETPKAPFVDGLQDVKATIINNGSNILDSVTINWTVNDSIQAPYYYAIPILPGMESSPITIGTFNFLPKVEYSIHAWSSDPNGLSDELSSNDSTSVTNLIPALIDTYTIGGVLPDFMNFNQAVTILNKGGVSGNVVFLVRDGIYNEQLDIFEFPGSSDSSIVKFISESNDSTAVTLNYDASSNATNYTVRLDGADYITFESMTFSATDPTYGMVMEMRNGAQHISFLRSVFRSGTNTSYGSSLIYSPSQANNSNCVIKSNRFINCSQGVNLSGYSTYEQGTIVRNNIFINQENIALRAGNQRGIDIHSNYITTNSDQQFFRGIYCFNIDRELRITSNKIVLSNGGRGIDISNCTDKFDGTSTISNNFVHIGGSNVSYGLLSQNSEDQNLVFNSVNVTNTNISSSSIYLFLGGANNLVQSNNLVNVGGGYAIYVEDSTEIKSSDYNNIYSSGLYMGRWENLQFIDLTSWNSQTLVDLHSISVDPIYVSDSNLHASNSLLSGTALPFPGVEDDIDGDPRHPSAPDIGADEFGCKSPTSLFVSNIYSNNVKLNWASTDSATSYIITGGPTGTSFSVQLNVPNPNVASRVVSNLVQNKEYWWTIQSVCSGVTANSLEVDTFKTSYSSGCLKPQNTNTYNITSTSAMLSWNAVPDAVQYEIQGRRIGLAKIIKITVPGASTTRFVSNLSPGKSYEWAIRALCPDTTFTSLSQSDVFTTLSMKIGLSLNTNKFIVYPNPFNNTTTIQFPNPDGVAFSFRVFDISGKLVYLQDNIIHDQVSFNRNGLMNGIYWIELEGDRIFRDKIVIN